MPEKVRHCFNQVDIKEKEKMKKLLLASAVVLFASNAMAGGLYVSPKLGLSFESTKDIKISSYGERGGEADMGSKDDNVFHAGLAVGYDFSQWVNLRVEGEYMYHAKADAKNYYGNGRSVAEIGLESSIHSLNANVYYDFRNSTPFTPYVGAGIGFSRVNTKFSEIPYRSLIPLYFDGSDDKTKFTYNLQAGLDFNFDDHNTIGIGYRYTSLGDGEAPFNMNGYYPVGDVKAKHHAHELTLSYRFTF